MAYVGYGYTRSEILTMATDYTIHLGKRESEEKVFSMNWFYSFIRRWPELRVIKPSSLSEQRAKGASEESLTHYFEELDKIMTKYHLKNKPEHIYNIDEKGINTEYRPQSVVAERGYQPQTVMGGRTKTVTVIGAGNAIGCQIPPFFVFPGQRMMPDLMNGKSHGADGTVTQSGWSNADVFRLYLQSHFMKYVQGRDASEPIPILYDGHKSHFSLDVIEWAKTNNIILFVLPPHCSHILQPLDVGCFGPFQIKYNQECQAFSRNLGRMVTRYDVCSLACKAYSAALTPSNLRSAFAKSGIFPVKTASEMISQLKPKIAPSALYLPEDCSEVTKNKSGDDEEKCDSLKKTESFFEKVGGDVGKKIMKIKRRNISDIVGGKAVTENETVEKMKNYINHSNKCKKPRKCEKQKETIKQKKGLTGKTVSLTNSKSKTVSLPQPGPSNVNQQQVNSQNSADKESDFESESQMADEDKCCQCQRYYVQSRDCLEVSITQWACCDVCNHWVHLKYCPPIRVVRKETPFKCPCC